MQFIVYVKISIRDRVDSNLREHKYGTQVFMMMQIPVTILGYFSLQLLVLSEESQKKISYIALVSKMAKKRLPIKLLLTFPELM